MYLAIEFRCWSPLEKKMYQIAFPTWNGAVEVWKDDKPQTEVIEVPSEGDYQPVLIPFVGRMSKDDKKIYYGDIVQCVCNSKVLNGLVTFINGCFVIHTREFGDLMLFTPDDVKIVGNVFENAQFLDL